MANDTPDQEAPQTKTPTHVLFHIEDRGPGKQAFWTEIAVGWENVDGSINIRTRIGALLLPGHGYQLRLRPAKVEVAASDD